ncbi:death-associated protein kinase 1-like [Ptychodera flava]|uniref:death-associated protein kinase 1-like n=1 Tax=Ptychodera flava TaxID=63121 RepID=UPI00396A8065
MKLAIHKSGKTPLHLAAANYSDANTRLLLESKASIDVQDENGQTPLHLAAAKDPDATTRLLSFVDVWHAQRAGENADMVTPRSREMYKFRFIAVSKQHCVVDCQTSGYATCSNNGQRQWTNSSSPGSSKYSDANTRLLLESKASIDVQDVNGQTPLHLAAAKDRDATTRLLLESKALFDVQDNVQKNAYVAIRVSTEFIFLSEWTTPLHLAAAKDRDATTRLLLESNVSFDVQDNSGQTPLHLAAANDSYANTRLLLESKASIDVQDENGQTPLHLAAAKDRDATTRVLEESTASVDVQDNYGRTPLDVAHDRRVKSMIKSAKKKAEFSVLMQEPGIKRNRSKLNVCGFGGVGKTTLMNALQRGFLEAYFTRRSEERAPPPDKTTHIPTPGIDVNIVKIPKLLLTWPRFIKSRISDDHKSDRRPVVIFVASGADMVEKRRGNHAIKVVEEIRTRTKEMFGKYLNIVDETFLLNCHDSRHKDMDRLRICLSDYKREEQIPKLCAKIADSKNKWQINEKFPIWYWPAYVEQVKKIDPLVEEDFLRTATSYLDNIGELLFIKNPNGDDMIVLNIQWLCSRVFGPMLATEIFRQYSKKLRKNKKFYSRSDIDEVFSEFADTGLLLNLLKIFELVFEAGKNHSVSDRDMLYIAPALLVENMPESQWRMDPSKQIYFGRRIQCRDETDSFSPGLFPRLQARLYNHFRDLGQTPSGIWKNGIKVCHVVECLVYMTRGWRAIHICVRAQNEEHIGDCHNLLEMVSEQINDVLEICCPGSDIENRVLSGRSLKLHRDPEKTQFYQMQKIVDAEMKVVNVYDEECGEEEATTDLLCAGYDTTLLRISGYECDVKWMMQDTLKKFTTIMDVKRDVTADYRVMADLMGIPHIEVQGLEGQSKTKEILSKWSEEWESEGKKEDRQLRATKYIRVLSAI